MNPRHRRLARYRRVIRDRLAHLGPLAKSAEAGTTVKRFGLVYVATDVPAPSEELVVVPQRLDLAGAWVRQ